MTEPRPRRALNEHEDSGAYALDAMGPSEREAFEAHVRECAACQRDVREFRETLSGLKELVGQPPPPILRGSILATIPQRSPAAPEPRPGQGGGPELGVPGDCSKRDGAHRSRSGVQPEYAGAMMGPLWSADRRPSPRS